MPLDPLPPEQLYAAADLIDLDFATTAELGDVPLVFEQQRAMQVGAHGPPAPRAISGAIW